jgi:hypothetical protein
MGKKNQTAKAPRADAQEFPDPDATDNSRTHCEARKISTSKSYEKVFRWLLQHGNHERRQRLASTRAYASRRLDMEAVAITWGRLVGQHFAIVKIKDVREKSYLQEICKYVVEGSELAKWEPDEINEFVQAIRGLRMFNSFGTLRDLAPQIRREIFATKPPSPKCKCGCGEFIYESEETSLAREAGNLKPNNSVRPHSLRICGVEQPVAAATFDTPAML